MKLSKRQQQRRREWLDDIFQDACKTGTRNVITACVTLDKLHPGQWDNHPAYVIAQSYVIDANPLA